MFRRIQIWKTDKYTPATFFSFENKKSLVIGTYT